MLPFGGVTLTTSQAKLPELPIGVELARNRDVGVRKRNSLVGVTVGVGVAVLRVGVMNGVGVADGNMAAVRVAAALAVCAIKVPIAPGFTVGTGWVVNDGIQAITKASAVSQSRNFVFCVVAISGQAQNANCLYFSTMMTV